MNIVLSLPDFAPHEADRITCLMQRPDVDRLHLRKPWASEQAVEQLLRSIPERLYPRIVIHDHYRLASRYGLAGIHLTGRHPERPSDWLGDVSTGCHSIEELKRKKAEGEYAYLSLSPIFDSISKAGYKAAFSPRELEQAREEGIIDRQVLALGGVTFDRIPLALSMGFGGVMILGDAWK